MWHLVEFLTCWVLLSPRARKLVYKELRRSKQPRVWRFDWGETVLIGD